MDHTYEVVVVGRMTATHASARDIAEEFLHIDPIYVLYDGVDLLVAKPPSLPLDKAKLVYQECVGHIKYAEATRAPSMVLLDNPASREYLSNVPFQLYGRRFMVEDVYVKLYLVRGYVFV